MESDYNQLLFITTVVILSIPQCNDGPCALKSETVTIEINGKPAWHVQCVTHLSACGFLSAIDSQTDRYI